MGAARPQRALTMLGVAVLQAHADLQPDLPMRHLAVLDVAAHLGDLEPIQVPQGFGCAFDGLADRIVGGLGGELAVP